MSDNHTQRIVNKAWSFAHLLRDDGLSYMEYTEQITFLLFLKMAHERTRPPWNRPSMVPDGLDWPSLLAEDGADLEAHYRRILSELSREDDGRWRAYDYEELAARDKLNLDLSWLRDRSLEDSENLPAPEVLAAEIAEDLRSALEAFEEIAEELARD